MLELIDLFKRYGDVRALDGASLAVSPGRMLGFLGPNGAGKTTAMRSVFGLVHLDQGDVLWQGRPVDAQARLGFGYMPEERGLYPRMEITRQLVYFGRLHGMTSESAALATASWLDELGLSDRAEDKVENLSHGNQQRIQLAAALVHDPELLVLDEPFAGLDPVGVERMKELLRKRAVDGAAVVFSSHQLDLVEDLVDDVAIINEGRIVLDGTLSELRSRSHRRHVEVTFEGNVEWLPDPDVVEVVHHGPGFVRGTVDLESDPMQLLAIAAQAGAISRFSFEPPSLSELFLEAVQA